MPETHLKQPRFTYSACGPFTKNKERIQKFKETEDTKYICKNELDRACFQHDMANWDFKDLRRKTTSDKVLRDKAFNNVKNSKYDGYQRGLASMVYKFFAKTSAGSGVTTFANKKIKQNLRLAEELRKPIRSCKKGTVYSGFKDKIWDADLAHMQLISKFNNGTRFLLFVVDAFSECAWVAPLKDKKKCNYY